MSRIEPTGKAEKHAPRVLDVSGDRREAPPVRRQWPMDRIRAGYKRLLKLRGTPREIALGFALGLYVGMSPAMGFQTIIAVPIATLLGWNKISAAMGVWISNPATAPFLYGTTYVVGAELMRWVTGVSPAAAVDFSSMRTLVESTPDMLLPMVLGGAVLGVPIAVAGYYVSLAAVMRYRERVTRSLSGKVQQIKEITARRRARSRSRKKKKRKRRKR